MQNWQFTFFRLLFFSQKSIPGVDGEKGNYAGKLMEEGKKNFTGDFISGRGPRFR